MGELVYGLKAKSNTPRLPKGINADISVLVGMKGLDSSPGKRLT